MPLEWKNVNPGLDPSQFNLRSVMSGRSKKKKDPMAALLRWNNS
jgi:DNA primase